MIDEETLLYRVEQCRKCSGRVLVHYTVADGDFTGGWGAQPISECGNPERCGEKVIGIDEDDLALVRCRMMGAA